MKNLVQFIKEELKSKVVENVKVVFDVLPEEFYLTAPEGYSESDIQIYLGDTIMTELFLLRHGQTTMNSAFALQGRSDHPLNEIGKVQADTAGTWFRKKGIHFVRVYSSPLSRAIQTAKAVVNQGSIHVDQRLIEMDYGPYDGLKFEEFPSEILTFFSDFVHNPAPDGMEQLSSVVNRAGAFLEEIKNLEGLEGNILISTHAIAMKGILEYLTPGSGGAYWSKYIGNCAVYMAECSNGRFGIPKEWKV